LESRNMKLLNMGYVWSIIASFSPLLINARIKGGDTCGSSFLSLPLRMVRYPSWGSSLSSFELRSSEFCLSLLSYSLEHLEFFWVWFCRWVFLILKCLCGSRLGSVIFISIAYIYSSLIDEVPPRQCPCLGLSIHGESVGAWRIRRLQTETWVHEILPRFGPRG
jgi:hypothetical protein